MASERTKIDAPWNYTRDDMKLGDPGVSVNVPTPDGEAIGHHLASMVEAIVAQQPTLPVRCHDCALRRGSYPNGCLSTLGDAVKCAMEDRVFACHVHVGQPCAGFVALRLRFKDPVLREAIAELFSIGEAEGG